MPTHANLTLPPPTYWEEFEDMLHDLFRAEWKDPQTLKHGRSGQSQHGIDIYGQPEQKGRWAGVQAKKKDQLAASTVTVKELEAEVTKARQFQPPLSDFVLATTGPRDRQIQEKARLLTEAHQKEGFFRVHVYSWEDIQALLHIHLDVCQRWYRYAFPDDNVLAVAQRIEQAQKEQAVEDEKSRSESSFLLATLTEQVRYLTSSITASGTGSQKVYQVAIDQANALLDQLKPVTALTQLEALRKDTWEGADRLTKWKILTNIGAAKFQLNDDEEAARLLIEAAQYNSDDEKALCNLALAYLLLGNLSKAHDTLEAVLQKNAANERAYALRVQLQAHRNENFERMVEQIPEEFRRLPEIASALGDAAGKYGMLVSCRSWFEIAFTSKDPDPGVALAYASSMLIPIIEHPLVLLTGKCSPEQRTQLETIIALYTKVYTKIADSEQLPLKLECLSKRGIAWRIKGNYEQASKDLDLASELDPKNELYVFQRAELAFFTGKKDVAIAVATPIKESNAVPAALLLAEIYKETGNPTKGIEILIQYAAEARPPLLKEQAQQLLIELLVQCEHYDEAEQASATLVEANPENVINILLRARVVKARGFEKEAQELRACARAALQKDSPAASVVALANQYYAEKQYEDAASLYELIVDISTDNEITRNLLSCYYQSGKEKETLTICTVLRQQYGALKIITEIESSIYEGIGNLEKAKEICKEYLQRYSHDLSVQIRLALIHLRQQHFEEVDRFLQQPHLLASASLEDRIHLSQLFSFRGFDDQALEVLYETRRSFFDASEAHFSYIATLFRRRKEPDPLLHVEIVAENTAVCLRNPAGVSQWYLIEKRRDADSSKNELTPEHPLAKKLLGKKAGERVVLVEAPQKKEGVIEEVKSKYLDALHKSLSIFESYFPETHGFSVLHLKMTPGLANEGSVDFSAFFDLVDKQQKHRTQVFDLYQHGPLTIGALAKLLHRNPLEVWGILVNAPDIGLRCATGDPRELVAVRRVLTTALPRLVTDITTLMTLHGLQIANEMVAVFGKMAITQSTIDQVSSAINSQKMVGEQGFMTVGKQGETYVKEDITASQIQKNAAYLQAMLDWIKQHCEVIPCEEALTLSPGHRKTLYDLFGDDAIDAVLLAKQEQRILVSEDERLRSFAKQSYDVDGAWTQALLEYMLHNGTLEKSTYEQLTIKLVHFNYHHTRITAETLVEAAKQSSWKRDTPFEKVAGVLSGGNTDDVSALQVASEFIYTLYTQQIFLADPTILLFATLDMVFTSRAKTTTLLTHLLNQIQRRFVFHPTRQREMGYLIQTWARSQLFF